MNVCETNGCGGTTIKLDPGGRLCDVCLLTRERNEARNLARLLRRPREQCGHEDPLETLYPWLREK